MYYLYAISRRDLPTHQQAIQAAHAQLEYATKFGIPEGETPTFIWLTTEDRKSLLTFIPVLSYFGLKVAEFSDPDFPGYELSAISCLVTEEHRFLFSHFSMWNCYEKQYKRGHIERFLEKINFEGVKL